MSNKSHPTLVIFNKGLLSCWSIKVFTDLLPLWADVQEIRKWNSNLNKFIQTLCQSKLSFTSFSNPACCNLLDVFLARWFSGEVMWYSSVVMCFNTCFIALKFFPASLPHQQCSVLANYSLSSIVQTTPNTSRILLCNTSPYGVSWVLLQLSVLKGAVKSSNLFIFKQQKNKIHHF